MQYSPGEEILELLGESQRGLTEAGIRRGLDVPIAEIKRSLRALQVDGEVDKVGGRWRVVGAEPPQAEAVIGRAHEPPEGLDVIRRVAAFHADVVHEIQSNKVELDLDDERLASELRAPVDWYRLARSPVKIARSDLPQATHADTQARTIFCGPLHLTTRRKRGVERKVWLPIFLLHARRRREPAHIEFSMEGDVSINMEWLEAHFAGEAEILRDDLLIRLGMLKEGSDGYTEAISVQNFEDCWLALQERVGEFEWRGERDLRMHGDHVDLQGADMEGIYPHVLVFEEQLSPFTKGLISELRAIANVDQDALAGTSLATLVQKGSPHVESSEDLAPVIAEASPLNASQTEAVGQALETPLTVVQGPPGTGKSTVVRSTLLSLGLNAQSAIFSSTNHRAIDAVVDPMKGLAPDSTLVADLRPSDKESRWTSQLLANLALPDAGLDEAGLRTELAQFEQDFRSILDGTRKVLELGDTMLGLSLRLDGYLEAHPAWGDSVQAADSTFPQDFLASVSLGDTGGRSSIFRLFGAFKEWLAAGRVRRAWPGEERPPRALVRTLVGWIIDIRQRRRIEMELRSAPSLEEQGDGLVAKVEAKADLLERVIPGLPVTWASRVQSHPTALSELRQNSSGGSLSARKRRVEVEARHLPLLLPGLPLWTITSLSASRAVPLIPGAFDLAIIDEAGQCNPASVLPILFRSKRAMFVGDPMQLRPVGTLSAAKEDYLRRSHGLEGVEFSRFTFSGRSAYDLAQDALLMHEKKPRLLREHYRCHPAIAEFFNEHFYDGALEIRTTDRQEGDRRAGISWTEVAGGSETKGSSRWHPPQVTAIVEELKKLAERGFDGSVGVVTPFREHAKRIRDAAHQAIGAMQASKWEFLSETADGFQGGERDLILFGLVGGGDGQARTPPFYLKERNRFNVAISRARLHLNVFGDRQWARQSGVPVLSALADAAGTGPRESQGEFRSDLVGPVWEPRLAEALREEGISFRQQYQAAGFYLDFAFFGEGGRRVNVEVDGETYHRDRDGNLREEDVRRDLVLRADGWTVKRYWVYQLREDWDSCIQEIKRLISNH